MNNNMIKEEELRVSLNNLIASYSQQGMSAGAVYYVFKDCFRDYEIEYNKFVNEQVKKLNEQKEKEEE